MYPIDPSPIIEYPCNLYLPAKIPIEDHGQTYSASYFTLMFIYPYRIAKITSPKTRERAAHQCIPLEVSKGTKKEKKKQKGKTRYQIHMYINLLDPILRPK